MGRHTRFSLNPPPGVQALSFATRRYLDNRQTLRQYFSHLLQPGGIMNGIGLLITVGFCTIIWWGTASYYKAIIKSMDKARSLK